MTIDWRQYWPHADLFRNLRRTSSLQGDVIYAIGDAPIRAAQRATSTIPILGSTDDMVESGLVKSLARPEGNTTGTSFLSSELDGKRQEILIEAIPGIRHIAALADTNRTSGRGLRHCRKRRAGATSSFQFIRSLGQRKYPQLSMQRRLRAQQP